MKKIYNNLIKFLRYFLKEKKLNKVNLNVFTTSSPSHTYFELGRDAGAGNHFYGEIDDVYLFNRSLSSQEILSLYQNTTV
jgi:hypothetical protein